VNTLLVTGKVAEFGKITWNCRECGKATKIIYSKKKGDRIMYVCEACNFKV
jgi:predicted RNA-binding Zn-ribbon protein involved in translation (DUF1610 family)